MLRRLTSAAVVLLASASFGQTGDPVTIRGAETIGGPIAGVPVAVNLRELPSSTDPIRVSPRRAVEVGRPVDTPSRLDPLLEAQRAFQGGAPDITVVHNFEGNHSTANPNDPTGDVGLDLFVELINGPGGTSVTMYSKVDGTLQAGPFALDTLAPGGSACANGLGDPIVLYDHLADRWLLTEFSSGGNRLCIYTSRTEDPITGGWCFYDFADTSFPDYPKYGVWPDLYLATANQGNNPPVYAFDRVNMLSPDGESCPTARATQKTTGPGLPGLGFEAFTPVDLDGPAPPVGEPAYFTRHRDGELHGDPPDPDFDRIELWTLDVDFDNSANTTFTQQPDIIVADFDSNLCPPLNVFSCVPQPDGGPPLDPLLEVIMNRASYRNFGSHASILATLQTDIGDFEDHSGVRWIEMRKLGGGNWDLFQEGTWSPDAEGRFMSTGAIDDAGNILLAYNVSSTEVYPSIRYTGRLASDPLGVMTLPETELATGNGVNNSIRYGDYNQMGVDPVDGCTFWFLGMYNPNPSGDTKGVRIGAVKFDACGEPGFLLSSDEVSGAVCTASGSDAFATDIDVLSVGDFEDPVTLSFDPALPAGFTGAFDPNPVTPGNSSTATITVDQTVAPDTFTLTVLGTATGVDDRTIDLFLTVVDSLPDTVSLLTPADGATDVDLQPELTWTAVDQTDAYQLQVATDTGFVNLVIDAVVEGTAFTPGGPLDTDTTYFWRVRGSNPCGEGAFSDVFGFTTFPGPPIADISPSSFAFSVAQGDGDSDTLSIGNLGDIALDWEVTTDLPEGVVGVRSHDPALDEPLDTPDFEVISPANGGSPVVLTVPAGVLTRGDVVGFSFIGTATGITGNSGWASDTCMIVEAPDGTTFGVGGISGTNPGCDVNDWDFQGSGSTNDGTYASEHDDVFAPAVGDQGDWTLTFINDWNSTSAPTISWTDVTVTLHKAPLPVCDDVTAVDWLSVSPSAGTTAPGGSEPVDVLIDTTGLELGDYEAALCVATNDPTAPVVPVPVALTVTEPDIEKAYTAMALVVDPEELVSDGNGIFEPNELVDVAPTWRNDGDASQSLMGGASDLTGPDGAVYTLLQDDADYGTLDPGQTVSCRDTGVCYQMGVNDPAIRPATHWEATFEETLSDTEGTSKTWTLHIGDSFTDVARTSPFYSFIETLLHNGVTSGCSSTEYCPPANNTRAQMSVFVLRGLEGPGYVPPACEEGSEVFGDVPFDHLFCAWIEELANRGVVAGCGGGSYCPGNPVTRAQMSIFLLRTLEGSGYTPPPCTGLFADVPCPSGFADWIEELYNREITSGCGSDPLSYCPANPVNRQQMAAFVSRTFGLTLYGP